MYRRLAEAIIEHPEDLLVQVQELRQSLILSGRAAPGTHDHGKLIGSGGVTFRAIRTVLELAGQKAGKTVYFIQAQVAKPKDRTLPAFQPKEDWSQQDSESLARLVECVMESITTQVMKVEWADGKDSTAFSITLAAKEHLEIEDKKLGQALQTIFHAVGKSRGRSVYVDVGRTAA